MTQEQYYWYVRRPQLIRAYNTSYGSIGAAGDYVERTIKDNLKEVWLDDFNEAFDMLQGGSAAGSCSSVRRGDFHGRNFDFTYDKGTTYVIHVKPNEKLHRHAFAGIAKATFNDKAPSIREIPNLMKDGINDCGVTVNINVVAKNDLDDCGMGNTETNPGLRNVHIDCVPAYILSYADSAVKAVEIMKNDINIYGYLGSETGDEYLHYMISDLRNTFVVEIIGNEFHVLGYDMNDPEDNAKVGAKVNRERYPHPIMTNWYLNYDVLPETALTTDDGKHKYTYHGCGIERFRILGDNYNTAGSVFDLMKMARYKNEIILPVNHEYFPFSDATGMSEFDYQKYLEIPELKNFIDEDRAKMENAFKTGNRTLGVWLTSHNAVYDISKKTFTLVFEEDYDNVMEFSL